MVTLVDLVTMNIITYLILFAIETLFTFLAERTVIGASVYNTYITNIKRSSNLHLRNNYKYV